MVLELRQLSINLITFGR